MPILGLHWQQTASWMRRVEMPAPYVKVVNPPIDNIFPHHFTIGRVYMTDGEEGFYYTEGKAGGGAYFDRCMGWYRQAPYVWAWESFNEPAVIKTPAERAALCAATVEWARLMHRYGYRVVVGNFSERNPADGTICEFAAMLDEADYLGVHCYGAPTMRNNAEGLALRYRRLIAELKAAGVRVPPILIGECGVDLGIVGLGRKGWQKAPHADWGRYRDDLVWYDGELRKDPEVVGGFVFTAAASKDWKTFEINEKQAVDLSRALAIQAPQPEPALEPLPENEQGDLQTLITKARWWSEEITRALERSDYGRAYKLHLSLTKLMYRLESMT